MKDLRIVYMGTPEFAVGPLEKLHHDGYSIAGVVTAPDKPAGRGKKLKMSAVKQFALTHEIPVLQPEKLKEDRFLDDLNQLNANLFVVVAFRMLPKVVWSLPSYGTFNLHASLLPQYRGAAPINHAIMNGERETGVTTFFIDEKIDTGKIIMQEKVAIYNEDDAGKLHDKLMEAGSELVAQTVEAIKNDQVNEIPQDMLIRPGTELKEAPKIFKEVCRVNWYNSCKKIHDKVRGLSPYPGAFGYFDLNGQKLGIKILKSRIVDPDSNQPAGKLFSDGKNYLKISCGEGILDLIEIQYPGKKRMNVKDFLRGFKEIDELKPILQAEK
jgi:methionyl-tRNA formyltransferase